MVVLKLALVQQNGCTRTIVQEVGIGVEMDALIQE